MQALAHFAFGMAMAILVLTITDLDPKDEFVMAIASGVWAILPDFWWLFREAGRHRMAAIGRAGHQSVFSNVFWFHGVFDHLETDRPRTEMAVMLAFLFVSLAIYYRYNDWSMPSS